MKVTAIIITLMLLMACNKTEDNAVSTDAEMRADSLQLVADSLMKARELHAMTTGQHVHAPGSNLAAAAHQDPAKIRRMRRSAISSRADRKAAARARAKRFAVVLDKKENNL